MFESRAGRLPSIALACIFFAAALQPALDYGFGPGDETLLARRDTHKAILNQTARTPDRYRWLSAAIVEAPVRVLAPLMTYDRAYDRVSTVFYAAAITAMLWSLFAYLRVWFPDEAALIATLLVACTIRITMRQHDYAPFSYLEPTFVSLALIAMVRRRFVWLGVIVAVASFNRETAIFLVMYYVATSDWSAGTVRRTLVYGAIWAAVYGLVRLVGGEADRYWTVDLVYRTNMSQPRLALFNVSTLLGALWLFAALGFTQAPAFVRRSAIVLPLYLVTVAVWGIWWEVRLLMPIFPIVLPLALSFLYRPRDTAMQVAA